MIDLRTYEEELYKEGFTTFCGVDEAGAGPLLGPVYAAAVVLPKSLEINGLNDSKKLSAKQRERLFETIKECAVSYCVSRVEAAEIDETDILSARMKAMQMAINGLNVPVDLAIIDGNRDKGKHFTITSPHRLVIHGDGICRSIAAASILAKVSRDRYCLEVLDQKYPQYQIAKHKGYGTALHYAMLDEFGPCEEHRKTFLKKWEESK